MIRKPNAIVLASLLVPLVPLVVGACTPAPSKQTTEGDKAAEAKPEDVCKHVREVADKDTDDAAVLDQVERECVESLTTMQSRYQTFTTCVGLAADANAIYECEKGLSTPRSLLASAGPTAKLEQLCDHVIKMLEQELGEATSQMPPGELAQLRTKCVEDAGAQLELKGVEAFNKEADCILGAQSIDALQACGL